MAFTGADGFSRRLYFRGDLCREGIAGRGRVDQETIVELVAEESSRVDLDSAREGFEMLGVEPVEVSLLELDAEAKKEVGVFRGLPPAFL